MLLFTRYFHSVEASLVIYTVKDRKETFALGEVFHELSAVTSRLERERVRTVYITSDADEKERNEQQLTVSAE